MQLEVICHLAVEKAHRTAEQRSQLGRERCFNRKGYAASNRETARILIMLSKGDKSRTV